MELKAWLTNTDGEDVRVIHDDLDFQVGGSVGSRFQVTCTRDTFGGFEDGCRIYVEGTEYGGIYKETQSVSTQGLVYACGYTWRGYLEKKVVQPPAGAEHMVVNGDILDITRQLIDGRFSGTIMGANGTAGLTVSNMKLDRYCTLLAALKKIYKSVNQKIEIVYKQTDEGGYAEVRPVLINDYSDEIELSKEGKLQFTCKDVRNGVTHMIGLGKGEGVSRTVIHLYADQDGKISKTPSRFGVDEIEEVYENPSAEDDQLEEDMTKRMKESTNRVEFDATASGGLGEDIAVGDIVSGVDDFTGRRMQKPIDRKIVRRVSGTVTIDYEVEQEA